MRTIIYRSCTIAVLIVAGVPARLTSQVGRDVEAAAELLGTFAQMLREGRTITGASLDQLDEVSRAIRQAELTPEERELLANRSEQVMELVCSPTDFDLPTRVDADRVDLALASLGDDVRDTYTPFDLLAQQIRIEPRPT